jgi:hypothetical protein
MSGESDSSSCKQEGKGAVAARGAAWVTTTASWSLDLSLIFHIVHIKVMISNWG